ncbi:MAG: transaldolase [Anaerolineae bacterium]|nr:transaldolase [Anaerolineae bacterium]
MELYVDSADVSVWQEWLPAGLFYGVTTNPLLLQRANVPCDLTTLTRLANTAFALGAQRIHLQVWGTDAATMTAIGRQLAAVDDRVSVKVPITREGSLCAQRLIADGISVTLTGVYAAYQTLTALALGADYAAPYLGRMNEAGRDGQAEILTMYRMTQNLGIPLKLLVASLRRVEDVVALAQHGVNVFTLAPAIVEALFGDPLTAQAAADFEAAARAMGAVDPA